MNDTTDTEYEKKFLELLRKCGAAVYQQDTPEMAIKRLVETSEKRRTKLDEYMGQSSRDCETIRQWEDRFDKLLNLTTNK